MDFPRNRFENGKGLRGIHLSLIDDGKENYSFVPWDKALAFLKGLGQEADDAFCDHLASYDPDTQAIALYHNSKEEKVVLAVYSLPEGKLR
jgi:hypothetical protein